MHHHPTARQVVNMIPVRVPCARSRTHTDAPPSKT
jgi:hypothetical protein